MNKKAKAHLCLDDICLQRLKSQDFALKKSFKTLIIRLVKGGAK